MNSLVHSGPGARRRVRSALHLRVESCPRHNQRMAASPAIRTAAISILHHRRSPETPKNGVHDRISAATGVSLVRRRQATDTVPPMHRDWRWACAVGGTTLQSAANLVHCLVFGIWFLVCYAATQLAIQLHQERIQVVRSNRVVLKRPAESNGTPAMDLGFEDIRKRKYTNKKGINKTHLHKIHNM